MPTSIQAGLGVVDITPNESIWLAGWANRVESSQGVSQPIFAKTLALQTDEGQLAAIVTSDLIGFSESMTRDLAEAAKQRFGIDRASLMLNASHNHSAPVTTDVLSLYYDLDQSQFDTVIRYTDWLFDRVLESIESAIQDLSPAQLAFGQGLAGFAVNRRRSRPGLRGLPTIVDQDVPVLTIKNLDGELSGIVFGYACHTTTINDGKINGDYAGYAQAALEENHPGAVAMFVAGCGADANPLPRHAPGMVENYGRILATAVTQTIEHPMEPIDASLHAAYGEATLPLQLPPTRDELVAILSNCSQKLRCKEVENLIRVLDDEGELPTSCTYPVQVWRFGDSLTWISLTAEAVVDYAIRLKHSYGVEHTWVSAYANHLLAYIPSRRVLEEGDYEGRDGMMEYGLPAPFSPEIEELIVDQVDALARELSIEPRLIEHPRDF